MESNLLSKEYLDAVKLRCQNATPAPWTPLLEGRDHTSGESFIARGANREEDDLYLSGATDADIEFIAHARQDIPLLLAEIERLQTEIERLQKIGKCNRK